jgi:hypothetical protein
MNSRHATTLYGERPAMTGDMTSEEQPWPVRHQSFIRTRKAGLIASVLLITVKIFSSFIQ